MSEGYTYITSDTLVSCESRDYTRSLEELARGPAQFASAKALSDWSNSNAPRPITVERALTIISQKDLGFAEDVVAELFEALDLPDVGKLFDAL